MLPYREVVRGKKVLSEVTEIRLINKSFASISDQ